MVKVLVQPGERRGSLTILGRVGTANNSAGSVLWAARCDCGTEIVITSGNFRKKDRTPSCMACGHKRTGAAKVKHGDATGGELTRLYRIWSGMKHRCNAPTADNYRWYGARGIRVCDAWSEFAPFREWAKANGYADNLTIDRYPNNDGNYEPSNCRWITQSENSADARRRAA